MLQVKPSAYTHTFLAINAVPNSEWSLLNNGLRCVGVRLNCCVCLSVCLPAMHAGPPLPVLLPASCITLDVTNACVGMLNGLMTVATMIEAGVVDYALVVDAETVEVSTAHCQCRHHCLIGSYACLIGSYPCLMRSYSCLIGSYAWLDACQLPSKALPPGATVMRFVCLFVCLWPASDIIVRAVQISCYQQKFFLDAAPQYSPAVSRTRITVTFTIKLRPVLVIGSS